MLPSNRASTTTLAGVYLSPANVLISDTHDFQRGGVAIEDTSLGLDYQVWECFCREVDVIAQPTTGSEVVLFRTAGITALSMCFDQSMRPVVAFERDGELWLWWWDSLTSTRRMDSFGVGRCPRVTLDDKRPSQIANSDIVFAYIKGKELCYRQQRDRYSVERVLRTGISSMTRLKNVAMGSNWRLKFELV